MAWCLFKHRKTFTFTFTVQMGFWVVEKCPDTASLCVLFLGILMMMV